MHSLRGKFKFSLRQLVSRTIEIYGINWEWGEETSKDMVFITKSVYKNDLTILFIKTSRF